MALSAEQKASYPGYPTNVGAKHLNIFEFAGQASYTTGGQTIKASDLGMAFFDYFEADMMSYSGTYYFRVFAQPVSNNPSQQKQGFASVKVQWIVAATGLEVAALTNLTGENGLAKVWGL